MILGIDEVGRGPWAGPLVIGAVVLGGVAIEGLTDSKKLTKKKRDVLDVEIREKATGFGLGWVSAAEIDEIGLSAALVLATKRAVEQVKTPYSEIIIDGTINFLKGTGKEQYVTTMKKADLLVPSVSAASIIAKVARDNYMTEQDDIYPGYAFGSHVGYGTAAHRAAIDKLGVTPLHRLSFAPLVKYQPRLLPNLVSATPSTSQQISPRPDSSHSVSLSLAELAPTGATVGLKQSSVSNEASLKLSGCLDSVDSVNGVVETAGVLRRLLHGQLRSSDEKTPARVVAKGVLPRRVEPASESEGANLPTGPVASDLRANSNRICDDGSGVGKSKLVKRTTKQIGDAGETAAANYLVRLGHEIIDRNWRTKYCEIDIISHHKGTLYFTEVKYRKNANQGGGLAAITHKKQNQMAFAAKYYALANNIKDTDLRLAAMDVTGTPPEVQSFLKLG